MSDHIGDPVAERFDRLLALTAYGLFILSIVTFWVPALIAAAIAFTHRRGADPLVASHFRFQLTIFWVGLALFGLAVAALLGAGGFAIGAIVSLLALSWNEGMGGGGAASAGAIAGWMTLATLLLFGLGALWTLLASLWGGYRLVSDRPIGQSDPGRSLEFR